MDTYGSNAQSFDGEKLAADAFRELKELNATLHGSLSDCDYSEYRDNLAPGQVLEPKGARMKTAEYRSKFRGCCEAAADRIESMCDRAERAARAEMTEAPDPSALAYCRALAERKGVTVGEMAAAIERYGSNWTCYRVLMDSVAEHRAAGERDFYSLNPKSTLDGWEDTVRTVRREASTFAREYFGGQLFRNDNDIDAMMRWERIYLGYPASNGGAAVGTVPDTSQPAWKNRLSQMGF